MSTALGQQPPKQVGAVAGSDSDGDMPAGVAVRVRVGGQDARDVTLCREGGAALDELVASCEETDGYDKDD